MQMEVIGRSNHKSKGDDGGAVVPGGSARGVFRRLRLAYQLAVWHAAACFWWAGIC